jgi:methionyl-tRNA formyltransferase
MKKRILFFGTPEIALPALESLAQSANIEVVGVGVFPDKPVGRKHVLTPCPVKTKAQGLKLPIFEIANKKDLKHLFTTLPCDLAIVIAFGMLFPESVLNIPKCGVVNVHFSLLPKYRGASPVQSAILNGDLTSGITFQRMVKKMDAGDVLFQKTAQIEGMKTSQVFDLLAEETADVLPNFVETFCQNISPQNTIIPQEQNESEATYCTRFDRADGEVFPTKETAEAIYRKYLAFDIFPGIFVATKKGNVKLTEVSLKKSEIQPVVQYALQCANKEGLTHGSAPTILYITRAQIPGKAEMGIGEILRGCPDLFENG